MKFLFITCALVCALIALASASISQRKVKYLAKKWAPMVKLAKGEKWNPSSLGYFLRNAAISGCDSQSSPITPYNLRKCSKNSYLTTKTKLKCAKCTNAEGLHGQKPSKAPVYAMYREIGQYFDIMYWFFFPYNYGKKVCIGFVVSKKCFGKKKTFGNHVGDWEHVTVRFKNFKIYSIYLATHDSKITKKYGGEYLWNGKTFTKDSKSLQMEGRTHAIVYSAKGSHGFWSSTGSHTYKKFFNGARLIDECSSGTSWYTWRRLKIFKYQSNGKYKGEFRSFQYEGRWGNKKRGCMRFAGNEVCVLSNGPTGPTQKSFLKNGQLG